MNLLYCTNSNMNMFQNGQSTLLLEHYTSIFKHMCLLVLPKIALFCMKIAPKILGGGPLDPSSITNV